MMVSFRVKLLASHALVALLVGAVTLVIVDRLLARRLEEQVDRRLDTQARGVAEWMRRAQHPAQLARRLAEVVAARVTILDPQGRTLGDSGADAAAGGQPVHRVELEADDGRVVRLEVPIGEVEQVQAELRRQLLAAALASFLVALGLAALLAGPLTRRLRDATAMARRIGAGDHDVPAPRRASDEVGVLVHALATTAGELRAAERRRRDFLADVAHEVRTPVTAIRGYAQVLAAGGVEAGEAREFLQTIQRNAERIGTLVEDLLELEALEAGRGAALAREVVPLAPVVASVVGTTRVRAAEVDGAVAVAVGDLRVVGDADAVERVLLNLVDNALRHGGPGVRVEVSAGAADGRTWVEVTDSGPGVPEAERARIFDRFVRGQAARDGDSKGTGLGLAIARELAVAMGGTLRLVDASRFRLELPSA